MSSGQMLQLVRSCHTLKEFCWDLKEKKLQYTCYDVVFLLQNAQSLVCAAHFLFISCFSGPTAYIAMPLPPHASSHWGFSTSLDQIQSQLCSALSVLLWSSDRFLSSRWSQQCVKLGWDIFFFLSQEEWQRPASCSLYSTLRTWVALLLLLQHWVIFAALQEINSFFLKRFVRFEQCPNCINWI